MTDRELLELAAKAAGRANLTKWSEQILDYDSQHYGMPALHESGLGGQCFSWNPLLDDGDALRLAVKLGLDLLRTERDIEAIAGLPPYAPMERDTPAPSGIELLGGDPYAATRRAIVRAAAEIGKEM